MYKIKSDNGIVTVIETETRKVLAEYRGISARSLLKLIDTHIANGGTLGNYQW